LNIGAAKPTVEEQDGVIHHMIDVCAPTLEFSVADYKEQGRRFIDDVLARGKTPIICGGTGYYIDALLYDFSYGNCPKSQEFRDECDKIIADKGCKALHQRLAIVDPETASILHENDAMRIVRALEIYHLTGQRKSEIIDQKTPVYPFKAYSYDFVREELYQRINLRVEKMFKEGLIDEIKGLLSSGVTKESQSMQGIGYKEVVFGLEEGQDEKTMIEAVQQNTRRYAKRQITWFKRLEGIQFIKPTQPVLDAIRIKEEIYG
ncbi:MAG: tRNA (adenosine(37)-N6)-dimethylallyltransferase MiaA, partial [Clostridia bacterium]|nr:tRNA (adenosine(37)-N6)-dimethylallyltransferase MiaA [Clostridia bacterium]